MNAEGDRPSDDEALVLRARSGDLTAFNALVLRHQDAVYSLALRVLGSPEAAEDATQEAFLRAYRALGSFRGGSMRAWLFSIVTNLARDDLRRRSRRRERSLDQALVSDSEAAPLDPPDPGPTPEALAVGADLRRMLEAALAELPAEWRLVIVLADVHQLSYEEVAGIAGLPLGTVKSRISRGRGRLRDILTSWGELPSKRRPEATP